MYVRLVFYIFFNKLILKLKYNENIALNLLIDYS